MTIDDDDGRPFVSSHLGGNKFSQRRLYMYKPVAEPRSQADLEYRVLILTCGLSPGYL